MGGGGGGRAKGAGEELFLWSTGLLVLAPEKGLDIG